jgi:fructose-1,6-bisphosphatase II
MDPQQSEEKQALIDAGIDLKQVRTAKDLVQSDDVFFAATGISGCPMLGGIDCSGDQVITQSIAIRGQTGSVAIINSCHKRNKTMNGSAA